jgi:hypothetical protein
MLFVIKMGCLCDGKILQAISFLLSLGIVDILQI